MDYFARCTSEFRPVIDEARRHLPAKATAMIEPRYLCGFSPHFVGLHYHSMAELGADHPATQNPGFTYETLAHACYQSVTPDGVQTLVYPQLARYSDPVGTILHEFGHLLDEATGFSCAVPTSTPYSRTNREERFAEGFRLLCRPLTGEWRLWAETEESLAPLRALVGA